jgi:hypothetical protein
VQASDLDEFDLAPADATQPELRTTAQGRARRRASPLPWVAAAVALVLVGAVNATPTPLVAGRGSGQPVGLTDLNLDEAPQIVWQTAASGEDLGIHTDRTILTFSLTETDTRFTGRDLATGETVWTHDDRDGTCQAQTMTCVEDAGQRDAVVVEIDLDDGTQTRTPHPGAIAAMATPRGLLVVESSESAANGIVLLASDGSEIWRTVGAVEETDAAGSLFLIDDEQVHVGMATTLDLATGVPPELEDTPYFWTGEIEADPLVGGGWLVHAPEGDVLVEPDQLFLQLDDDVGGPITLHYATDNAVSARVGSTEIWREELDSCWPMARLRGVILEGCAEGDDVVLVGRSELTGDPVWGPAPGGWPMLGSDDVVVVDQGGEVIGLEVVSGRTLWSVPTGSGTAGYTGYSVPLADGVLTSTDGQILRLRWVD